MEVPIGFSSKLTPFWKLEQWSKLSDKCHVSGNMKKSYNKKSGCLVDEQNIRWKTGHEKIWKEEPTGRGP